MENTFKVSNLDAITWLKGLEDDSVDLVITDPPYESLETTPVMAVMNTHDQKFVRSMLKKVFVIMKNVLNVIAAVMKMKPKICGDPAKEKKPMTIKKCLNMRIIDV